MSAPSLRFNQQTTTTENFNQLVPDGIMGTKYEEGFTCLNVYQSKVYMNERELNRRELKYGTVMPKIYPEQIILAQKFAEFIATNERLSQKRIFLLCSNDDSRWLSSGPSNINILGYYNENNQFIFAALDNNLAQIDGVKPLSDAKEIFAREGIVIIPNPDGTQPITVVHKESNYHKITQFVHRAKNSISEFLPNTPIVTDAQAFFYILVNFGSEKAEEFISVVGNEKKRQFFQTIKENYYYFYTLFDSDVLAGNKKIFLRYRDDLTEEEKTRLMNTEKLHELWKNIYGAIMKNFQQNQGIDVFKQLASKPMFIKFCRLCCRFKASKHYMREL